MKAAINLERAIVVLNELIEIQLDIVARDQQSLERYKAKGHADTLIVNANQLRLNERYDSLEKMAKLAAAIKINITQLEAESKDYGTELALQMQMYSEILQQHQANNKSISNPMLIQLDKLLPALNLKRLIKQ